MDIVSKNIESFGVKRDQTLKILYYYAKDDKSYGYKLPISFSNLLHWLKLESEIIGNLKKTSEKETTFTYPRFQQLLKEGDFERLHSFLTQRGSIPPEIDVQNDVDPLLDIYLSKGSMDNVKKLLQML